MSIDDLVVCGLPRFATPRTDRLTAGHEAEKLANLLGFQLLPWQRQVFDVALEYNEDPDFIGGRDFVYRELSFGTPRQSGKSLWCLVKLLHRSIMMGEAQASVYTMQTGADASRRLLDDWAPTLQESDLAPALAKVRRSVGSELMQFKTRSTLEVLRSGKSAGHGRTLDEAHIDEAMHDVDERREQAVVPAMFTRQNPQMIATSTAGTDESLYWRRKVDEGRKFAQSGVTEDVAYFEWSFPDDADPYDENVWREFHPALGHTQPIKAMRHAAKTMLEMEFRRALGNQWTRQSDKIIDWAAWIECRSTQGSISGDLVLAAEVNKERTHASICAASWANDGIVDVEMITRRQGISWLTEELVRLRNQHNPLRIVVDGSGPIGAMIPELNRAGIDLHPVTGGEFAAACGGFYDRISERSLRVRPNEDLDDAVAGAAKYVKGDRFVWRRSTPNCDISPLVCATLAAWGIAGDGSNTSMWMY